MNPEHPEVDVNRKPQNGSPSATAKDFAFQAKALMSDFPANLDAAIRSNPYRVLGIACAVGLGAGILTGSRILRSVLVSGLSYAAVEFGRAYLRQRTSRG
jgi:hypothetical protein